MMDWLSGKSARLLTLLAEMLCGFKSRVHRARFREQMYTFLVAKARLIL